MAVSSLIRLHALAVLLILFVLAAPLGCGGDSVEDSSDAEDNGGAQDNGDADDNGGAQDNGDGDGTPQTDEEMILAIANTFVAAVADRDEAAFLTVLHPAILELEESLPMDVVFEELDQVRIADDPAIQVEGDTGSINVVDSRGYVDSFDVARVDGRWYFDPHGYGGGDDSANVMEAIREREAVTSDLNNLNRLMETFIVGHGVDRRRTPSSTGYRFWIALFVGDGPEGDFQVESPEDAYLPLSAANLLRSPLDPNVLPRDELERELRRLLESGEGAAGARPEMCSYAGPRGFGPTNSPRAALMTRRNQSGVVGATGVRDGETREIRHIAVVNQDGMAQVYTSAEIREDELIPSDEALPGYGHGIFAWTTYYPTVPESDNSDDE